MTDFFARCVEIANQCEKVNKPVNGLLGVTLHHDFMNPYGYCGLCFHLKEDRFLAAFGECETREFSSDPELIYTLQHGVLWCYVKGIDHE